MWKEFVDFFYVVYHMIIDNLSSLIGFLMGNFGEIFGENWSNVIKQALQGLQDWPNLPVVGAITDWWIDVVLSLWDMPFLAVFFGAGLLSYILISIIKWIIGIVT